MLFQLSLRWASKEKVKQQSTEWESARATWDNDEEMSMLTVHHIISLSASCLSYLSSLSSQSTLLSTTFLSVNRHYAQLR